MRGNFLICLEVIGQAPAQNEAVELTGIQCDPQGHMRSVVIIHKDEMDHIVYYMYDPNGSEFLKSNQEPFFFFAFYYTIL